MRVAATMRPRRIPFHSRYHPQLSLRTVPKRNPKPRRTRPAVSAVFPSNRSEAKSEASRSARPFPRDFAPDRSEAKSEAPPSARPSPRDFAPDRSEAKSEVAGAAWLDLDVIIL